LAFAVLLSARAHRTVLSTAVIFLVAGFLVGEGALHWVKPPGDDVIQSFSEVALFTILFVDGADVPVKELRNSRKLPGRALLFGMPLTILGMAVAGHFLLGLNFTEALLVGSILSPTDPMFVSSILERSSVPLRLRRLLSVESGLNDGIALPLVVVLLALLGHRQPHLGLALLEAGLGVVLGVALPVLLLWLEKRRIFEASPDYQPLGAVAIAMLLFGVTHALGANAFLAAFAAGVTIATMRPKFAGLLRNFGLPLAELLKLATLLVFGAVLSAPSLLKTGLPGLGFALIALLLARPLALVFALRGGGLSRREWLAAAWFGPKGFASLLYALLLLESHVPRGTWLFQAIALVIVLSIIAHSSTDVLVARLFPDEKESAKEPRAR
jgi:NhaP-type Na+/H+ or K+/H+ antiporter